MGTPVGSSNPKKDKVSGGGLLRKASGLLGAAGGSGVWGREEVLWAAPGKWEDGRERTKQMKGCTAICLWLV